MHNPAVHGGSHVRTWPLWPRLSSFHALACPKIKISGPEIFQDFWTRSEPLICRFTCKPWNLSHTKKVTSIFHIACTCQSVCPFVVCTRWFWVMTETEFSEKYFFHTEKNTPAPDVFLQLGINTSFLFKRVSNTTAFLSAHHQNKKERSGP